MVIEPRRIQAATLAGRFYPAEKEFLGNVVERYFATVVTNSGENRSRTVPKAVIAPHSGYIYSGPVAAAAFAVWKSAFEHIRRLVVIGPSHQFDFPGLALPDATTFATPLGELSLDHDSCEMILKHKFVRVFQAPYENEQSIEVLLPFLQRIAPDIQIVPLITGHADSSQIAALIEELWGGEETVFVISSDLSRSQKYTVARRMDSDTSDAIQKFEASKINSDHACGYRAIRGFLKAALQREMSCQIVDLRNSADTAAVDIDITGFGAFHFYE